MNAWQVIVSIVIALLGYPVGLLIAKLTEEELEQGRKWFMLIILLSIIGIILSFVFTNNETLLFLVASFVFIALVALASLVKSRRRKR
ncbi:MAG: hypothetical protein ACPLXC_02175 [Candidatus Pacearchaeota archaeon]